MHEDDQPALQFGESVSGQNEWVGVAQDALAASRNGNYLAVSSGLALLSVLVSSESSSMTAWPIDSSNPWCEVRAVITVCAVAHCRCFR